MGLYTGGGLCTGGGGLQYIQGAYTWTTLVTKYLLFIISMKRNKNYIIIFNIWGGDYSIFGGELIFGMV